MVDRWRACSLAFILPSPSTRAGRASFVKLDAGLFERALSGDQRRCARVRSSYFDIGERSLGYAGQMRKFWLAHLTAGVRMFVA